VSQDVRIREYFTKPTRVRELKSLGNSALNGCLISVKTFSTGVPLALEYRIIIYNYIYKLNFLQ